MDSLAMSVADSWRAPPPPGRTSNSTPNAKSQTRPSRTPGVPPCRAHKQIQPKRQISDTLIADFERATRRDFYLDVIRSVDKPASR